MALKQNAPTRGRVALRSLSADTTLVAEDTGVTFLLDAVGEDIIIPAAALANRGVWYRFVIVVDVITSVWSITSAGSSDIHCQMSSGAGDDIDVISAGTGKDVLNFVHTVALQGDEIYMYSTGTFWMATGHTTVIEGITTA